MRIIAHDWSFDIQYENYDLKIGEPYGHGPNGEKLWGVYADSVLDRICDNLSLLPPENPGLMSKYKVLGLFTSREDAAAEMQRIFLAYTDGKKVYQASGGIDGKA